MAETLERENFIYTTRRIIARTIHSAHCTTVERSRLSCNLDRIAVYSVPCQGSKSLNVHRPFAFPLAYPSWKLGLRFRAGRAFHVCLKNSLFLTRFRLNYLRIFTLSLRRKKKKKKKERKIKYIHIYIFVPRLYRFE